jgi:hypothetical protein
MTETQRVPAPRLPFTGHGDLAVLIAVGILAALVIKPWGAAAPDAAPSAAPLGVAPGPTGAPAVIEPGFAYDQSAFGNFEPAPEWSIWPGGFFVTLLYTTRAADAMPSIGPPRATPEASPSVPAGAGWPPAVTIGPGDHLLWLGLDTPEEYTVRTASLWRLRADGTPSPVEIVRLPSSWGPYFAVFGIPIPGSANRLSVWPRGSYEVSVILDPTGETRTIRVDVQTLLDQQWALEPGRPR